MKVKDLIEQLQLGDPEAEVTAQDTWEMGIFNVDAILTKPTTNSRHAFVVLLPGDD